MFRVIRGSCLAVSLPGALVINQNSRRLDHE